MVSNLDGLLWISYRKRENQYEMIALTIISQLKMEKMKKCMFAVAAICIFSITAYGVEESLPC